ncbi:MAG TPA: hypothetical protein PLP34_00705 [Chitinophagaceae bacterium]|nr:hypothetical protein [Chitinophagaceae bacterium]HNF70900.1 hypothetical protein [Chitinophagaceae bacterium]
MKRIACLLSIVCFSLIGFAQDTYTMGYDRMDIDVVDPAFFSEYQLTGQPAQCGMYDQASATFYTCDYQTFRNVEEDFVHQTGKECCSHVDFDPSRYYGTLTLSGIIDSVEWDNLIIHFVTDKARITIKTDEREIDALYDKYYKKGLLGKLHIKVKFITYDNPKEAQLSYNRNTERKAKPKRTFTRILRW